MSGQAIYYRNDRGSRRRGFPVRLAGVVILLSLAVLSAKALSGYVRPGVDPQQPRQAANNPVAAPVAMVDAAADDTVSSPPSEISINTKVEQGDTLASILADAGALQRDAEGAIQSFRQVFDPRRIRPGQRVAVILQDGEEPETPQLALLQLEVDPVRTVTITRDDNGEFHGMLLEKPLVTHKVRAEGVIEDSLYNAALRDGVPLPVLGEMMNIFSFDVDFQREVRKGDGFALVFEDERYQDGRSARHGNILMAEMTLRGEKRRYYRFEGANGDVDYFDENGRSARKALLKTPVDGARISSGFGMRRHPVLGYSRKHQGVDFAAPVGTPIYAAGRGVVERAGYNGGYGNYVLIRHEGNFKTAYAHLHKIARGIRPGQTVAQGQRIGSVGTTGLSTGPHLHYEVHRGGQKVNPLGLRLPTGRKLKGEELQAFLEARDRIESELATMEVLYKEPQETAHSEDDIPASSSDGNLG